jgi:hypothetical protein
LTPSTTFGLGGFTDSSTPSDPAFLGLHTGGVPVLFTGRLLPTHGVFGPNTNWQEFFLGDFTLNDSPVADFIDQFPTSSEPNGGQINVYDVSVPAGYHGAILHFDVYDHVEARNGATFAPFSHDGGGPGGQENILPEPSTLIIWSLLGVFAITGGWWQRRRAV